MKATVMSVGASLRTLPEARADLVDELKRGDVVEVLERTRTDTSSGRFQPWAKVRVVEASASQIGGVGWMWEPSLNIAPEPVSPVQPAPPPEPEPAPRSEPLKAIFSVIAIVAAALAFLLWLINRGI